MRLASVTSTTPLQVRRDGDRVPVPAVETTETVALNDRVLVETIDNQVFVIRALA